MIRKLWWAVLAIGVFGVIAPFVLGLPDKVAGGEAMMSSFEPIMDEENVQITADYYNDVFVPLGDVAPAMSQENIDKFNGYLAGFDALGEDGARIVPTIAAALDMSEEDAGLYMAEEFPAMTQMLAGLPQMQEDFTGLLGLMGANVETFAQVPDGLDHYEPLVTTMQAQQENYDKAASMPDFRAFTWVFLIPGIALVALSVIALVATRKEAAHVADDKRADMDTKPRERILQTTH